MHTRVNSTSTAAMTRPQSQVEAARTSRHPPEVFARVAFGSSVAKRIPQSQTAGHSSPRRDLKLLGNQLSLGRPSRPGTSNVQVGANLPSARQY